MQHDSWKWGAAGSKVVLNWGDGWLGNVLGWRQGPGSVTLTVPSYLATNAYPEVQPSRVPLAAHSTAGSAW